MKNIGAGLVLILCLTQIPLEAFDFGRLKEGFKDAYQQTSNTIEGLSETAERIVQKGGEVLGEIGEVTLDTLTSAVDGFSMLYRKYGESVGTVVQKAYQKWGPQIAESLVDVYNTWGPQIGDAIYKVWDDYGEVVGNRFNIILTKYGPATLTRIQSFLKDSAHQSGQFVINCYYWLGNEAGDRLLSIYRQFGPQIGDFVGAELENLWDNVSDERNIGIVAGSSVAIGDAMFKAVKKGLISQNQYQRFISGN